MEPRQYTMIRQTFLSLLVTVAIFAASVQTAGASHQLAVDVVSTPSGVEILPSNSAPFDADGEPGWRMSDRFRGFRFVSTLPSSSTAERMASTMAEARKARCFGWIQAHTTTMLVGEARCTKDGADALLSHMRTFSATLELKEYATTKIRFHFPSFRVLNEPRYVGKTCFPTPPHACSSYTNQDKEKEPKDEL